MSVRDVLMRSELADLGNDEALSVLRAGVDVKDSTPYSMPGLRDRLYQNGLRTDLLIGMRARIAALPLIGRDLEGDLLSAGKVDFSIPALRDQLAAVMVMVDADSAELLQAILDVGSHQEPVWKATYNLLVEPTLQDIAEARATIASEALWSWFDVSVNAVRTQMSAGQVLTRQQAADAVLALLGAE